VNDLGRLGLIWWHAALAVRGGVTRAKFSASACAFSDGKDLEHLRFFKVGDITSSSTSSSSPAAESTPISNRTAEELSAAAPGND